MLDKYFDQLTVGQELKGNFLNGAIEVETEMGPDALMRKLLAIERSMGRKPVPRSGLGEDG